VAPAEAPPSLVIVVDEFATLVKEIPDFMAGNTNYTETGMANPASAMVRATSIEVQHLAAWNDNPTGSAALSAGSHIQAQPIPVS
jgi:hypothetical protein